MWKTIRLAEYIVIPRRFGDDTGGMKLPYDAKERGKFESHLVQKTAFGLGVVGVIRRWANREITEKERTIKKAYIAEAYMNASSERTRPGYKESFTLVGHPTKKSHQYSQLGTPNMKVKEVYVPNEELIYVTHEGNAFLTPTGFVEELLKKCGPLFTIVSAVVGSGLFIVFYKSLATYLCTNFISLSSVCTILVK